MIKTAASILLALGAAGCLILSALLALDFRHCHATYVLVLGFTLIQLATILLDVRKKP